MSDKKELKIQKNPFDLGNLRKLIDTKTREEIAQALGCDTSLITKHYNNQRLVQTEYLIKYAKYFDVTVDYILGLTTCKSKLDTDEGKLIRSVSEYTGLSEETIEKIHSVLKIENILVNVSDRSDNEEDKNYYFEHREKMFVYINTYINTLLSSRKFYEAIESFVNYEKYMTERYNSVEQLINEVDKYTPDEAFKFIGNICNSQTAESVFAELDYYKAKGCIDEVNQEVLQLYKSKETLTNNYLAYLLNPSQSIKNYSVLKPIIENRLPYKMSDDVQIDNRKKAKLDLVKAKIDPIQSKFYEDCFGKQIEEGDN